MISSVYSNKHRAMTIPTLGIAGASLLFAACGSSSKPTSSAAANQAGPAAESTTTAAASPAAAGGASASNSSVTVSIATIPGLGRVVVNGDGRTLYVLASEKGGKVRCTDTGGCTKYWPAAVLPSGMAHGIAGSGVQSALLGTATGPSGDVRLTYAGWPLYTYVGDSQAGQATGQGVRDSFGVWWVLSPSGTPITTSGTSSSATSPGTSAPASGGAGF